MEHSIPCVVFLQVSKGVQLCGSLCPSLTSEMRKGQVCSPPMYTPPVSESDVDPTKF